MTKTYNENLLHRIVFSSYLKTSHRTNRDNSFGNQRNSWLMVTISLYVIVVIGIETATPQKNPSNQIYIHSWLTAITNKIVLWPQETFKHLEYKMA